MQAHLITSKGIKRPVVGLTGGAMHIDCDELTLLPGMSPARYHSGRWRLGDHDYSILRIESPVTVHLEAADRRSAVYGPFAPLLLVDGVLLSHMGSDAIAQFDLAARKWIEQSTQIPWDRVVLTAA